MNKRITIKEIARLAGVSIGTVDRVLHDRGRVAENTREKIQQITRDGNYLSNPLARNLKLGRTFNIATLLPSDDFYWRMQMEGITQGIDEYESFGFFLKGFSLQGPQKRPISSLNLLENILAGAPDALILASTVLAGERKAMALLGEAQIPIILIDSDLPKVRNLSFIGQDAFQSGMLAAKLLDPGYLTGIELFVVTFDEDDLLNKSVNTRIDGFKNYYKSFSTLGIYIHDINLQSEDLSISELKHILLKQFEPVHLFIPNFKAYLLHNTLKTVKEKLPMRTVGYDLLPANQELLQDGTLDFIIHQKPKTQGYLAVKSLYQYLILGIEVLKTQYMSIDIITKENLNCVQL